MATIKRGFTVVRLILGGIAIPYIVCTTLFIIYQKFSAWLNPPVPKSPEQIAREAKEWKEKQDAAQRAWLRHQEEKKEAKQVWRSKYSEYLRSRKWQNVRKGS